MTLGLITNMTDEQIEEFLREAFEQEGAEDGTSREGGPGSSHGSDKALRDSVGGQGVQDVAETDRGRA